MSRQEGRREKQQQITPAQNKPVSQYSEIIWRNPILKITARKINNQDMTLFNIRE